MNNEDRFELFRLFSSLLIDKLPISFEEEETEEVAARRHRENQILVDRAIALTEQSQNLINEENEKLIFRAITLTDLLLKRLEDSAHNYQLVINHPRYQKGERVIFTSGEKTSIEIIENSYFDFSSGGWLYELQSDHCSYYPETDLSTNL